MALINAAIRLKACIAEFGLAGEEARESQAAE